jgi:hypothetical protein
MSDNITVISQVRNGSYRGRLKAHTDTVLNIELRIEKDINVVSADFFRDGTYYGSLRGHLRALDDALVATDPRFIFDWQADSAIAGRLEIRLHSAEVLAVTCIVPDSMPTEYQGNAVFDSDYYRTINIEVDKLLGLPWPPEYSTRDIPADQQPADLENLTISVASVFRKAGINARVSYNDSSLPSDIGSRAGRPGEEDRWDEREMHELMSTSYSRSLNEREWWLYLLMTTRFDGGPAYNAQKGVFITDDKDKDKILNDGVGTTGIIFDHKSGDIMDPWSSFRKDFHQDNPNTDFGREGAFANARTRQGVSVFWHEMQDYLAKDEKPDWYQGRELIQTIMHELGHALNMPHSWLVGRSNTTSFMNYPQNYPHGGTLSARIANYWNRFDYKFDPEELFHMRHGFYNEVIPGGKNEFMRWTSSSVFVDPTAGGTRSNISLRIRPTKGTFQFTEPVTVEVNIRNHSSENIPIGKLSPAYGDVHFAIRKPTGVVQRYNPPLFKCEAERTTLAGVGSETGDSNKTHVTSLMVGAQGFVFDTPGRYEVTATISDPSSGIMVVAEPTYFWVAYPNQVDEAVANQIFTTQAGLFLYMAGGEHLSAGRDALEEVVFRYPEHPFSAHANLVLGLNLLYGQKSPAARHVTRSKPAEAAPYLMEALKSGVLPAISQQRLRATLNLIASTDDGISDRRFYVVAPPRIDEVENLREEDARATIDGLLAQIEDPNSPEITFTPPSGKGNQYSLVSTNIVDESDEPVPPDTILPGDMTGILETLLARRHLPSVLSDDFNGTDRRAAKLSIPDADIEPFANLAALIDDLPSDQEMINHDPEISSGPNSDRVIEERRNVRVRVWLYMASREGDNDFHLIFGPDPDARPASSPIFMTMELSGLPPSNSPHFAKLKAARNAFKRALQNKLPGTRYKRVLPPLPVEIEGALFFDITHSSPNNRSGPEILRPFMPTAWEIHPISKFTAEP